MATSGTTSFDLDFVTLAEEAYERCGKELRSGYQLQTARRSLNLLTIEWASRGLNMWTIEQGSQVLTASDANYDLPTDTVDLLDHVLRVGSGTTQSDVSLSRISMPVYAAIPNKNVTGRPLQLYVERLSGNSGSAPRMTLWPVPDASATYTVVYWRMRRIQDAGDGVENQDMPFRFLPALAAGLAYQLALKLPDVQLDRLTKIEAEYEKQFNLAAGEDRERASVRFVPRL